MNQPFFPLIVSILASIFFGVISNWIFEILRKQGFLPDRPNLKKIIILVSLAIILLTNLKPTILSNIISWVFQYAQVPNWLIIISLTITTIMGFWAGQLRAQKWIDALGRKNEMIDELENSMREQFKPTATDLDDDIINPT